jgi:hypothetical protein
VPIGRDALNFGHVVSGKTGDAGRRADGVSRDLGHVVRAEIGDAGRVPRDLGHEVSAGERGA